MRHHPVISHPGSTGVAVPFLGWQEIRTTFQFQKHDRHGHQESPSKEGAKKGWPRQQAGLEYRPIAEKADRVKQENRRE